MYTTIYWPYLLFLQHLQHIYLLFFIILKFVQIKITVHARIISNMLKN